MARVVVELPADRYEQLQRRAQAAGKSPESLSGEILAAALGGIAPPPPAAKDTSTPPLSGADAASAPPPRSAREILEAAGRLRPLGPTLERLIIPGVTLEEVRDALTRAGGPSLSDIIIEQRGPKE